MAYQFDWDEAKNALNRRDHGFGFELAAKVFDDPLAVDFDDARFDYGEDRFVTVGMVRDRLLHVTYTQRGDTIHIISARGAEPHERRKYHEESR